MFFTAFPAHIQLIQLIQLFFTQYRPAFEYDIAGQANQIPFTSDFHPARLANIQLGRRNAAADAFRTMVDAPAPCGEVSVPPAVHGFSAITNQGIRLADLARAVVPLSPEQAARYSAMAPADKRLGLEQVQRLMPPVQKMSA